MKDKCSKKVSIGFPNVQSAYLVLNRIQAPAAGSMVWLVMRLDHGGWAPSSPRQPHVTSQSVSNNMRFLCEDSRKLFMCLFKSKTFMEVSYIEPTQVDALMMSFGGFFNRHIIIVHMYGYTVAF